MQNENLKSSWPQTEGQLVLAELLKQAGPTEDQKRTQSVIDGWIQFKETLKKFCGSEGEDLTIRLSYLWMLESS